MVETFPIIPAEGRVVWPVALVVVLLVLVFGLLAWTMRGSRTSRFEVSPDGLRLRGDLYGRLIPAEAIRGDSVRVVDLTAVPELRPQVRTFGTSLGGYQAGWFRLRNREKALLYLTDRRNAVYVPTTKGYSLLLSPREPQRFVERVKAITR